MERLLALPINDIFDTLLRYSYELTYLTYIILFIVVWYLYRLFNVKRTITFPLAIVTTVIFFYISRWDYYSSISNLLDKQSTLDVGMIHPRLIEVFLKEWTYVGAFGLLVFSLFALKGSYILLSKLITLTKKQHIA